MLKKINYVIIILTIMLLVNIIYYLASNNEAVKTYEINNNPIVLDNITDEVSNDIIGNINIPGINLDYSLVQGLDNEYYLNHDVNKKESKFGAIFLDYQSDLNNSNISYIYGHSSNIYNLPFNKLTNYLDDDYLHANDLVNINYLGDNLQYKIVSAYKAKTLKKLDKKSKYLVLQTCDQSEKGNFVYLIAQKIF